MRKLLSSIGPRTDRTRDDSDYIFSEPHRSTYGLASVNHPTLKERYSLERNNLEFPDPLNGDQLAAKSSIPKTVYVAFTRLMAVVLPSVFAQLFAECISAANILTVSRLNDPEKTAGIGLGMIFVNVCCQSILFGLN